MRCRTPETVAERDIYVLLKQKRHIPVNTSGVLKLILTINNANRTFLGYKFSFIKNIRFILRIGAESAGLWVPDEQQRRNSIWPPIDYCHITTCDIRQTIIGPEFSSLMGLT